MIEVYDGEALVGRCAMTVAPEPPFPYVITVLVANATETEPARNAVFGMGTIPGETGPRPIIMLKPHDDPSQLPGWEPKS